MSRFVLLNVSMLLLLVGSSIAWAYPTELENAEVAKADLLQGQVVKEDTLDDVQQQDQEEKVVKGDLLQGQVVKEDETAVANYDEITAEISQAGACGCNMRAYDKRNYGGRSLVVSQQNADFRNDYFNDRIESLRIYGNCQWILYQHINFGGQSYVLNPGSYSSSYNWGSSGNRISSARALPPRGKKAIVLFQHVKYGGRMLVLYGSAANLPLKDFNDQLSSFIITGGTWRLYEHINYRGRYSTFRPGRYSIHSLGGVGGNDKVSSVKYYYYG